ncbi:MAG: hypothetical protein KAV87_06295 [Desulfobacteraceae bacterium]|nr:hypothetical protein [Desulfobacteraceae bacterium]
MKFIKKNWIPIALGILIIVLLGERACRKSTYKEDIRKSDEKIAVLESDNLMLDAVVNKAVDDARVYESRVAEIEEALIEREFTIKRLRRERAEVTAVVMELPPSELVLMTQNILDCAEIELRDDGVLFSVGCTQAVLIMAEEFSLVKEELDETRFALSESQEAMQLQKMCTWSVYKIAWGQGSQIMNYQDIIKEKDYQFDLCQKKKKGSFLEGLWRGFVTGVALTAMVKFIFGKLI